jgi:hypothetical protein
MLARKPTENLSWNFLVLYLEVPRLSPEYMTPVTWYASDLTAQWSFAVVQTARSRCVATVSSLARLNLLY